MGSRIEQLQLDVQPLSRTWYPTHSDSMLQAVERLRNLRVELGDLSFRQLLKRVYDAHPESAARSVAKDVLE